MAAACLIAPLSLFVHDYMLETLRIPYPKTAGLPLVVTFVNTAVRLLTLVALCRLSRPQLLVLPGAAAAVAAGVVFTMLGEMARVLVIESTVLGNWRFATVDIAPRALSSLAGGSAAAWVALGCHRRRTVAIASVIVAALVVFALRPALDALSASVMSGLPEPAPLYSDPYPWKVNVVIYATFIEPTLAAFAIAAACWPALAGGPVRRVLTFAALLLLVRGRVISMLVESFWVAQPLPTAFLAESQFFLETLTLGVLVALAWNHAGRSARGT